MKLLVLVFAFLTIMRGAAAAEEAAFKVVLTNGNEMQADRVWIEGARYTSSGGATWPVGRSSA